MPFIDRDNVRLHYEITDLRAPWIKERRTILFHHGICATLDLWNGWLPQLVERYRIVRFDMRGYGGSSMTGKFSATFDALVGDLVAVADASESPEFHVVGESLGGTVAIATALRYPERVRSLTITNAAAHGPRLENVRTWRDMVQKLGQAEWARRMMEWRCFPDALEPAKADWFFQQHAGSTMEVTLSLADLLLGADLRGSLSSLKMPMLIISPDSSPFISVDLMAEIHRSVPHSEMLVVPHAKHGLPLTHGALCGATLRDFLARA